MLPRAIVRFSFYMKQMGAECRVLVIRAAVGASNVQ